MAKESKVCPFEQEHKLFFFNVRHKVKHNFSCGICFLPLLGLRHACFRCGYLLHESCLGFPWEMTLPFHPEHPFVNKDPCAWCLACFGPFQYRIIYNCERCVFINLHLSCANSLWQAIGSKSHQHPLFYFGTECQKPLRQYLWNLSFLFFCSFQGYYATRQRNLVLFRKSEVFGFNRELGFAILEDTNSSKMANSIAWS
ncbi:hypothetical protein QQP08_015228 [Theobroma cacao]|nr:hypothetical protein QQP08_015228 [Theobroma cacao]